MPSPSRLAASKGTPPWPVPAIHHAPQDVALVPMVRALVETLEGAGRTVFLIAPGGEALYLSSAARRLLGPCMPAVFAAIRDWRFRATRSHLPASVRRGVIRIPHETHQELRITLGLVPSHAHLAGSVIATVSLRTQTDRGGTQARSLTPREAQVASLIGEGLSYAEIGQRLGVTLHTVRRHTERIFAKYGVHSRALLMTRLKH